MNVYERVEAIIKNALQDLQQEGELPGDMILPPVESESPRDKSHGDIASNIAMVLAKPARMKPRDIAEKLKGKLESEKNVSRVEVAGPGFLNISFDDEAWWTLLRAILKTGTDYGRCDIGNNIPTNVEYVSANPTGPMHVGHCRGAVFGDALANLLDFAGYDVTREYYVNDAGGQIDVLAKSAHLRYREALGEDIGEIPSGLYPGDYLVPLGQALAKEFGDKLRDVPEEDWLPIVREHAVKTMLDLIKSDLSALNITHDVFFSEQSLTLNGRDQIEEAIGFLRDKDLIYEGRLPKPKGHEDDDWEDREQTLFRSTKFGDDVDRALKKSDGTYTYFAGDIAYHYNKLQRGFLHLINVFGADHIGYLPRMKAAVDALSQGKADFDIKVCQLVKLFRAGEPVRMSKRAGTFVTLRDVVDEVGRDPVRFMMLYRKNDAPLDFDFAKVTKRANENPVFYVQYAHARCASVFRNAQEAFHDLDTSAESLMAADLSQLTDLGELGLIKELGAYPKLISGAAGAHEPHRLAFYLYDLANTLHRQYARGNDLPQLRFIQSNNQGLTSARLAMIAAVQQVLSSGLRILGVQAPESMR